MSFLGQVHSDFTYSSMNYTKILCSYSGARTTKDFVLYLIEYAIVIDVTTYTWYVFYVKEISISG